jgi:hypothetical protein
VSGLDKILHVDVWSKLHPATKLLIKILQHVRSKVDDLAEVRVSIGDDDEILVSTHKSSIYIAKNLIEFKRKTGNDIRVQRAKVELNNELIDVIKKSILDIVEHDADPDYGFIVELSEKTLRKDP